MEAAIERSRANPTAVLPLCDAHLLDDDIRIVLFSVQEVVMADEANAVLDDEKLPSKLNGRLRFATAVELRVGLKQAKQLVVIGNFLFEDDAPVRTRLARILEGWDRGSLVAACATLSDAINVIDREPVDLLITDLRLPDGNGITAINRLKAISPEAEAMVISVLADEKTVLDAIAAGAAGYLHKDAFALDLLDAVNDLLAILGDTPVIFITAFPERLLTGERPEPAFLISKPYSEDQVRSAISQAMFFSSTETLRA